MSKKTIAVFCLGVGYALGLAFFYAYPAVMFIIGLVLAGVVGAIRTGYTAEAQELSWLKLNHALLPGLVVWASCLAYVLSLMAPMLLFAALSVVIFVALCYGWQTLYGRHPGA